MSKPDIQRAQQQKCRQPQPYTGAGGGRAGQPHGDGIKQGCQQQCEHFEVTDHRDKHELQQCRRQQRQAKPSGIALNHQQRPWKRRHQRTKNPQQHHAAPRPVPAGFDPDQASHQYRGECADGVHGRQGEIQVQRVFLAAKDTAGGPPALDGVAQFQYLFELLQQASLFPAQRPGQRAQGGRHGLGQLLGPVGQFVEALAQRGEMVALFARQRAALLRQFIEKGQLFGAQTLYFLGQRPFPALRQQ